MTEEQESSGVPQGSSSLVAYLRTIDWTAELEASRLLSVAYTSACRALLGPDDEQADGGKNFKKKSAWRKLARHFRINTRVVSHVAEERHNPDYCLVDGATAEVLQEGREEVIATVVVEATAPWGQRMEAIGVCSTHEKRYHWPGPFAKAFADTLATAETRATNRAISNLIAAGEVSHEEVEGTTGTEAAPAAMRTVAEMLDRMVPPCPKCHGRMWDNRKENDVRAAHGESLRPDWKCRSKECTGRYWRGEWPKKEDGQPGVTQPTAEEEPSTLIAGQEPTGGRETDDYTGTVAKTEPAGVWSVPTLDTKMTWGPPELHGRTLRDLLDPLSIGVAARRDWFLRNTEKAPEPWREVIACAIILLNTGLGGKVEKAYRAAKHDALTGLRRDTSDIAGGGDDNGTPWDDDTSSEGYR